MIFSNLELLRASLRSLKKPEMSFVANQMYSYLQTCLMREGKCGELYPAAPHGLRGLAKCGTSGEAKAVQGYVVTAAQRCMQSIQHATP